MEARIARRLDLPRRGVAAALLLLDEGATVPFIARYRKERTGSLDEVAIRRIEEEKRYLGELDKRRETVLATIDGQGSLTPELERRIRACEDRTALEDLYLPFRPKRKTRAGEARKRGLEPLARRILAQPRSGRDARPREEARRFVDPARDVPDVDAALAGARDIAAEVVAERADVRQMVREILGRHGRLRTKAIAKATRGQRTRFEDYYDHIEPVSRVPSHRYLAIERGEREGVLRVALEINDERLVGRILDAAGLDGRSGYAAQLKEAVADGYKRLLRPAVVKDVRGRLKQQSDLAAVEVFAANLGSLLLAPPLGQRPVIGVDPGFRTGCKCAALSATGDLLDHLTIHPHAAGKGGVAAARRDLGRLIRRHRPAAVAVGNGTAGRETEAFAREVVAETGEGEVLVVSVNEAGASVYSASDLARAELPDVDLTVRGAVSIGRRLQDPLAELVKIEPRAIGVGQYQHDVHQPLLTAKLADLVESCVNRVGVELNTASPALLAHVSGIGPKLAERIVEHRAARGPFATRRQLLDVAGLGAKTFEQAAGFLRIREGAEPLDASAVHPERYALVAQMARDLGVPAGRLVGDGALAARLDMARYVGGDVGEPTLRDIVAELARPGRDPRESFEAPSFREDVREMEDLREGMVLDGVVTNVTHFGAFVDVGVHQDGLIHISQLADRFVRDPHEVAHAGQRLRVRVLAVDLERKRISLSARKEGQRRDRGNGDSR